MDKEWNSKTLLAEEEWARLKSDILLEDFEELRPLIKNIKVAGEKWLGLGTTDPPLRVYDITRIDFRIPGKEVDKYPRHIIRLISEVGTERVVGAGGKTDEYVIMNDDKKENLGKREFAGSLRCKVMRVDTDINTGVTVMDVQVTGRNRAWEGRG
jgi:hypothetical protein